MVIGKHGDWQYQCEASPPTPAKIPTGTTQTQFELSHATPTNELLHDHKGDGKEVEQIGSCAAYGVMSHIRHFAVYLVFKSKCPQVPCVLGDVRQWLEKRIGCNRDTQTVWWEPNAFFYTDFPSNTQTSTWSWIIYWVTTKHFWNSNTNL